VTYFLKCEFLKIFSLKKVRSHSGGRTGIHNVCDSMKFNFQRDVYDKDINNGTDVV
jgi:hypothetical protein